MTGEERRNLIRRQLHGTGGVTAAELAKLLGVSLMTVWRDLGALEKTGQLQRVHGGAVATVGASGPEPRFATKAADAASAKRRIARTAIDRHINPGLTIALEGGSTVAALMPFLPTNAGLTVLTNSLEIVRQAPAGVTVHCSGGIFREVSQTFVGPHALRFFEEHRADVAFISATGLDATDGLMDPNPLEIEVKRALCHRSDRIVLLLDRSKFGRRSLTPVLPLAEIDVLITNATPPRAFATALTRAKIRVSLARG